MPLQPEKVMLSEFWRQGEVVEEVVVVLGKPGPEVVDWVHGEEFENLKIWKWVLPEQVATPPLADRNDGVTMT